jgi:hypothetical protein
MLSSYKSCLEKFKLLPGRSKLFAHNGCAFFAGIPQHTSSREKRTPKFIIALSWNLIQCNGIAHHCGASINRFLLEFVQAGPQLPEGFVLMIWKWSLAAGVQGTCCHTIRC